MYINEIYSDHYPAKSVTQPCDRDEGKLNTGQWSDTKSIRHSTNRTSFEILFKKGLKYTRNSPVNFIQDIDPCTASKAPRPRLPRTSQCGFGRSMAVHQQR